MFCIFGFPLPFPTFFMYNIHKEVICLKQPLAYRMRPQALEEVLGQAHLLDKGHVIRRCVEEKRVFSMIFYGPPGTGKTTLASVIANEVGVPYRMFNAVTGNKKDLETIFQEAKFYESLILIIDEVHRLNKDKQDLLLPHVENGNITMIGATTSNPLHSINPAIRSRCHLFEIRPLQKDDIKKALLHALQAEKGLDNCATITEGALDFVANGCNGDLRYALNVLEISALSCENGTIDEQLIKQYIQLPNMSMDRDGDGYYDVLSAFQKSIRGSDVDAALYYLGVMILANDMESIERRLLVTAYEDIGLGNPAAIARCVQAVDVAKRVGFPEARIPLSVAIIDLCLSPKSKSSEHAIDAVMSELQKNPYQVPGYLRLSPVNMDKDACYDYERDDLWNRIQYLPDHLKNKIFYTPSVSSAYEKVLGENVKKLRQTKRSSDLKALKKHS